jgi:hypothetical protein
MKVKKSKRSQVGVEYLLVVGFISFAIISILALSYFYSGQIKDRIKLNQVEGFATQLVGFCESVFFAGEPSMKTVRLYLPDGVESIEINSDNIVITTIVSGGAQNKRVYESKVPLQGSITVEEGIKKLSLEATQDYVLINQN